MRGKLQGSPIKKSGETIGWRVRVDYVTETGGRKKKGFDRKTLKAAQDAAIEWLGQHGRTAKNSLDGTVSEAVDAVDADLWAQLRGDNTRNDYKRCAEALREEFGDRLVSEVTSAQLTRYYKRFSSGSPRMMTEHWKVGRSVFGYAVSDLGWIDVNPMVGARKPAAKKEPRQWPPLARSEFDQILAKLEDPYHLFYRLVAETGARPSEVWGLDTGERIEFIRDVYWFVVKKGKSEASTRRVPIPDSLARDILAKGPKPFAQIADMAYSSTHLRYIWEKAMLAAKIPYTRPYEVRAMRINEWRRMAIPGVVRKTMAGHTSEKTTNDWYDHINAEEVLRALGIGAKDDEEE